MRESGLILKSVLSLNKPLLVHLVLALSPFTPLATKTRKKERNQWGWHYSKRVWGPFLRSATDSDFPRPVRSDKRSCFAGTVFARSKPTNWVRILPKMFMFLTENTKTDFLHIETILNWHVNLRKNFSKPLLFDETSSADIGWLNLNRSFQKRTLTSWGEKWSKMP